jgi:hypothetical protein
MKNFRQQVFILSLLFFMSLGVSSCLRDKDADPEDTQPNVPSTTDPVIFQDLRGQ